VSSTTAQSLIAWIGFPILLAAVCLGLGLLIERVVRIELPTGVLAGAGAALAVILTYGSYRFLGTAPVALTMLLLPALAGWGLGWRSARKRLRPGPLGLVALAAYLLVLVPVVASGRWTWTGYNFVNDTAIQLLLADWLPHHGFDLPAGPRSTRSIVIGEYLRTAYPAGSHALLGTLKLLVPAPLMALYQPFLGGLVAILAVALTGLARAAGVAAKWAVVVGLASAGANLFYQYALQGNVKEVLFATLLATAVAMSFEVVRARRPERAVVPLAIAAAAAFLVYSTAALPFLLALAGTVVAVLFLQRAGARTRRLPSLARLAAAALAGVVVSVAFASPGLSSVGTFTSVAKGNFATADAAKATGGLTELGHLARPLPKIQVSGVWLTGDYRFPVEGVRSKPNGVIAMFILVLAALALAVALVKRRAAVVLALGPVVATVVLLLPRVSPYAAGKVLAIGSVFVIFAALLGAHMLARRWRWIGAAAAAVVLAAVGLSDALAYHVVRLAPLDRLDALHDIAKTVAHDGVVAANEPEEFGKNVMAPARMNMQTEAATLLWPNLEPGKPYSAHTLYDWDQQGVPLPRLYGAIVTRRSPAASRPEADFVPVAQNRWYASYRRVEAVRVLRHLPLGAPPDATAVAGCDRVRPLVKGAPPDASVVASWRPEVKTIDVRHVNHSAGWVTGGDEGHLVPYGPGQAGALRRFAAGRYRMWISGTFGRAVHVTLDGRRVGKVRGVDTRGGWVTAGTIDVPAGVHRMGVVRDGGDLKPGDGNHGEIGPVAFQRDAPARLVRRPLRDWRSFCGKRWDWVEVVRRGASAG
jgi:hypothetical protein